MKVQFQDIIDELDDRLESENKNKKESDNLDSIVGSNDAVQKAVIDTTKILIKFLAEHTSKVEVTNHQDQVEVVSTPDVQNVVVAVASLEKTIKENHVTDVNTVEAINKLGKLLEKLPNQIVIPETKIPDQVTVKNQVDYSTELQNLSDAIKKIDVRPEVTVKAPKVDVKTDSKDVINAIADLKKAVEEKPVPIPMPTDLTPLILATQSVQEAINNQQFPIPNYILPFQNPDGAATQAKVNSNNELIVDTSDGIALVAQDLFGSAVSGSRYNQVEIDFSTTDPDAISDLTITKTVGGDASNSGGQAVFATGTNTNSGIKAVTNTSVTYRPHAETFVAFTAIFTAGIANSYQRIGLYDTNNGFFIGYEGTSFGVTKRSGAVDTTTAKASFSEDTLSGQSTSKYTRNGVPEAIDLTKDNLFRIRFGWLGAAPIYFEVFSPDGEWIVFHKIKHPNTATVPTVQNPNLPITLDIKKTNGGATVLTMNTACWAAGSTSNFLTMTHPISDSTLAGLNRSVIAGRASSGGGTYYNVKVNPSGSLETNATVSGTVSTESAVYYKRLDDTTTLNMIYIGEAQPSTATSAASWRIKRLDVSSGLIIQWAGGGAFTQIWDNRSSLTYS